jgi:hypothetical protein
MTVTEGLGIQTEVPEQGLSNIITKNHQSFLKIATLIAVTITIIPSTSARLIQPMIMLATLELVHAIHKEIGIRSFY